MADTATETVSRPEYLTERKIIMYNIGIVREIEQQDDTYTNQLNQSAYQLYSLSREEVLNEVTEMDALIIEESSSIGLKHTCELILEIRRHCNVLIWIVSKNQTKTNKIVYLQLGADGVLNEDGELEASMLQFTNLLNRVKGGKNTIDVDEDSLKILKRSEAPIKLVDSNLSVIVEGNIEIGLTRLEFETISYLAAHKGKAITYEEMYKNIWKGDFNDTESANKQYRVSNMIFHIRKKLETSSAKTVYIKTVRSKGYMLVS